MLVIPSPETCKGLHIWSSYNYIIALNIYCYSMAQYAFNTSLDAALLSELSFDSTRLWLGPSTSKRSQQNFCAKGTLSSKMWWTFLQLFEKFRFVSYWFTTTQPSNRALQNSSVSVCLVILYCTAFHASVCSPKI